MINEKDNSLQALIMAPTHELARQIKSVLDNIGRYLNISSLLLVGGTSVENDKKLLSNNKYHVIVGTPGRIQDMIRRKCLKTKTLKLLIIDEADEMLSSGFKEQISKIFSSMPEEIKIDYLARRFRMNY